MSIFQSEAFFGVISVPFLGPGRTFLGPLNPFPILRGVPKYEEGIDVFSGYIVDHKSSIGFAVQL